MKKGVSNITLFFSAKYPLRIQKYFYTDYVGGKMTVQKMILFML